MVVDSLSRWLASPELSADDGHCLSWCNPAHPGYPYPELSGLLLSFLSRSGHDPARAGGLHEALSRDAAPDGVRRGSVTYAFDTAMALRGLLDHRDERTRLDPPVPAWTAALIRATTTGRGTDPGAELTADTRWSMAFGAHQAKIAAALLAAARHGVPVVGIGAALTRLRANTLALSDEHGRFRIHAASSMTYLHAHCYALEGLAMMAEDDPVAGSEIDAVIGRGVAWLAFTQGAGGGWRAWHDGRDASGPERTDATAQAVRLMRLLDADGYRSQIAAAQAFLVRVQGVHPGVPYEPGSGDLTAWSTLFTAQALAPVEHPLGPTRPRDLV